MINGFWRCHNGRDYPPFAPSVSEFFPNLHRSRRSHLSGRFDFTHAMMNRRRFIKITGAAAAGTVGFPAFIPGSALGRANAPAPSDRIALASIGLGGQGTYNMRAFIQEPDVQLVALCDVNSGSDDYDMLYQFPGSSTAGLIPGRNRALQFQAEAGRPISESGVSCHHDFRELLELRDVDAVCVSTPDFWHGLISKAAAERGKDVYCEKPLVGGIPEGRALCEAVSRHGRVLQTGSHERSNDSVRFACELVRNGRIGELREIHVHLPNNDSHHQRLRNNTGVKPPMPVPAGLDYDFWLGPAPWAPYTRERCHFWWRFILDTGAGEITDRGAHILDLAQFINNTDDSGPIEISAKGSPIGTGLYNTFIEYDFECRYSNGVRIVGTSGGERGLKLVGTEGWIFIYIHGGRLEAQPSRILKEPIAPHEVHVGRSPGHHRNFLDCVKSRLKPVAHEEIGHRTASLCHLVNIAMRVGRPLEWDPVRETILNDPEADRLMRRPMRSPWRMV
jgi:predicted dehydrogenase